MKRSKLLAQIRDRMSRRFAPRWFGTAVVALLLTVCELHAPRLNAQYTPPIAPIPAFDLMWDPVNGVDANSLPLSPVWRLQKAGQGLPDFKKFCGPAFAPLYEGVVTNSNAFTGSCSSQGPTLDLAPQPIPCDAPLFINSDRVFPGHLNWAITTHPGTISWSGYDNFDGDFNLELTQPGRNAETALNTGTEYGIHLEFKGTETTSNFTSPWWVNFRNHAFASHNASENVLTANLLDNKAAVVTGLLGIDGVHGGYTELHPVFSMAVETDHNSSQGGADAHWAFFLRNQGSEGCCSNHLHQWDGLIDPHGGWNWYFIQLPPPPEIAPGTKVTVSVVPQKEQVWANVALAAPIISSDAQYVYLAFRLPPPAIDPELDGEISLHYTIQNPASQPTIRRPILTVSKARMIPRGDDWEEVRKHMQPADLKKLDDAVRVSQLASAKPRPHTVRLAIPPSVAIVPHQAVMGAGHRGQLTRTRMVIDATDAAAREQLNRSLGQIVPKEIVRPRP